MNVSAFTSRVAGLCERKSALIWPPLAVNKSPAITAGKLCYKRGKSTIRVAVVDLFDAYLEFRGRRVSSANLTEFRPQVFDSSQSGHSCNITLLYCVLLHLNLADQLEGSGRRGSPYSVRIR